MANEEKLLNLVNVIGEAKDRNEWNQLWFVGRNSCGTTMCAAGWQAEIDGMQPKNVVSDILSNGETIFGYAKRVLELTGPEAHYLFFSTYDNNYDHFVARVKRIINGEVTNDNYNDDPIPYGEYDYATKYPVSP